MILILSLKSIFNSNVILNENSETIFVLNVKSYLFLIIFMLNDKY